MSPKITELLTAAQNGDERAKEEIIEHLLTELRAVAHAKMQHERAGHTWQTSDLLHEAIIRLDCSEIWSKAPNRLYLYAATAIAMYRLLVEHARKRAKDVDGPSKGRIPFDDVRVAIEEQGFSGTDFLDTFESLRTVYPKAAAALVQRVFSKLTNKEIAAYMEVSEKSIEDYLAVGRAWLRRRILENK